MSGCAGDRACVFPVEKDGFCTHHLRDRNAYLRPIGISMEEFVADKFCYYHMDRLATFILPSQRGLCDTCKETHLKQHPMASGIKPITPLRNPLDFLASPSVPAPLSKQEIAVKLERKSEPVAPVLPAVQKPVDPLPEEKPSPAEYKTFDRSNSRSVDLEKRKEVEDLLCSGYSIGDAAEKTEVSLFKVRRIRERIQNRLPEKCRCGMSYAHRGWCKGKAQPNSNESAAPHRPEGPEGGVPRLSQKGMVIKKEIESLIESLQKERAGIDEKIDACQTVLRLTGELWGVPA